MFKRFLAFSIAAAAAAAITGCAAETDPARETSATSELTTPTICFTCDLDPTVHACSTDGNRAQYVCNRHCIVCDDFGDNIGECFSGMCEPDIPWWQPRSPRHCRGA